MSADSGNTGLLRPHAGGHEGQLDHIEHHSRVLQSNPWGDPARRRLAVYRTAGSEDAGPLPVFWDLAAYTNSGPGHLNWKRHGETLLARIDRLVEQGRMGPSLFVFPDCYTTLGGNQYLNSAGVGRYADYLIEELVPLVDERFDTRAQPSGRAVFGKSSGGYGALALAMLRPGVWGAVAAHAADVGFDRVYQPDFPNAARVLGQADGDIEGFIHRFWHRDKLDWSEFQVLMTLCLAATYDPDPDDPRRIRLPFDLHTCQIDPDRWQQWLRFDPLNLVENAAPALRQLRALWIDVGSRDQYHIQFGTRQFHQRLQELKVPHHFEEFDGTHSGLDWRLDHSLPALYKALQNAA